MSITKALYGVEFARMVVGGLAVAVIVASMSHVDRLLSAQGALPEVLALKVRVRQLERAITACQAEAASLMTLVGQTRSDLIRLTQRAMPDNSLDQAVITALGGNPTTDRLDWSTEMPVLVKVSKDTAPPAPADPSRPR